jgi:hypothetical protein
MPSLIAGDPHGSQANRAPRRRLLGARRPSVDIIAAAGLAGRTINRSAFRSSKSRSVEVHRSSASPSPLIRSGPARKSATQSKMELPLMRVSNALSEMRSHPRCRDFRAADDPAAFVSPNRECRGVWCLREKVRFAADLYGAFPVKGLVWGFSCQGAFPRGWAVDR